MPIRRHSTAGRLAARSGAGIRAAPAITRPNAIIRPVIPTAPAPIESRKNGVKRQNLAALAKPLGLHERLDADCEELLTRADTWGAKRGAIAHLSTVTEELPRAGPWARNGRPRSAQSAAHRAGAATPARLKVRVMSGRVPNGCQTAEIEGI
jgi:hypothetical protein